MMKARLIFFVSSLSVLGSAFLPQRKEVDFNRDVKPILSEHCFKCHGPDAAVLAAGLRLDQRDSATKRAITPGKAHESLLIARVSQKDPDLRMPPKDSGVEPLSPSQIETLERWIEGGAKYDVHWSFVPPQRPVIPPVSDYRWAKNPIDRFVLARLDRAGLKPEPEADRTTLMRRATLTLTGLPPTPEEVEMFMRDDRPDAYERLVDRLLASPRYGEHQARYWLDAVRYGDTHGLHLDNERSIYPYRDWVVHAFNEDLPFDKFTLWQLAGDLLPNPTTEQLVATGYVRMNPTTSEGGAIEAEFQAKNTFDRVDTTSTVFLGLTVACARCHDHKYDPIRQKDYYRLFAFLNSTAESPLDGNEFRPAPVMAVPSEEQAQKMASLDAKIAQLEASVQKTDALRWLMLARQSPLVADHWQVSHIFPAESFDQAFDNEPEIKEWKDAMVEVRKPATGLVAKDNAAVYVRAKIHADTARRADIRVSSDDGVKVWLNGKLVHSNKVLRGLTGADPVRLDLQPGDNEIRIKIVNGAGGDGLLLESGNPRVEQAFQSMRQGKLPTIDLKRLYLTDGPSSPASMSYQEALKAKTDLDAQIPYTLIAKELAKPRPAYILRRGEYSLPTTKVDRGIPTALGSLPPDAPKNRLGLARWLVDDANPLTARVLANRIWQQHFGVGIVKTSEDFGSQGEFPVNKPLLDYLAVTLRDQGWSLKKLNRLIVTSAAFRQRATISADKLEQDPENRLISRGPRFRLDAEVIRDQALAAGGLLVEQPGGKGFKPYQPDGLWEAIAFSDSTTARYMRDKGPGIYRRSLYLFWKRTSPHPVMLSFDAPMREMCTVRRSRTNTPLQALVTLNEPAFVEAARAMAERVALSPNPWRSAFELALGRPPKPEEVSVMTKALERYRQTYLSHPEDAAKLLSVGDSARNTKIDPSEHAAWTMVCSTLMNTDEFLTQH
jgi:hypothetical protein